jgi:hypothetical protein
LENTGAHHFQLVRQESVDRVRNSADHDELGIAHDVSVHVVDRGQHDQS